MVCLYGYIAFTQTLLYDYENMLDWMPNYCVMEPMAPSSLGSPYIIDSIYHQEPFRFVTKKIWVVRRRNSFIELCMRAHEEQGEGTFSKKRMDERTHKRRGGSGGGFRGIMRGNKEKPRQRFCVYFLLSILLPSINLHVIHWAFLLLLWDSSISN